MRLDKFLAEASVGTRKDVRSYIKEGKVKVNDEVIMKAYSEVNEEKDVITYLGDVVVHSGRVYYMFNKPAGYITARKDEFSKTVFDFFHEENSEGIFHVGRLDKDTEGLLLFTNDGDFNNNLMCPEKHVKKRYFFIALGFLDEGKINLLESGISIGEDEEITKPAKLDNVECKDYGYFNETTDVSKFYSMEPSRYDAPVVSGYLTISEGRKHQVKRMLKAVGCYVIYLKRISIGDLSLDETLEMGEYRALTENEINSVLRKS